MALADYINSSRESRVAKFPRDNLSVGPVDGQGFWGGGEVPDLNRSQGGTYIGGAEKIGLCAAV